MKEEALIIYKTLKLIYNRNIDDVEQMFKGKVDEWLLDHLMDMKNESKTQQKDNTKAWVDFILRLDMDNLQLFTNHVKQNNL